MQSPNNAWSDLLLKYLANTISGPELEELHRQIGKSGWKKEQFLRVSDPDHFIQALREHHQVDIKKEWAKLLKQIPAGKVPVVIPLYKKPWVITTTAAVATVAAVYIMLWVFSPGKKPVNYSYVETDK